MKGVPFSQVLCVNASDKDSAAAETAVRRNRNQPV